jgi:hypothetical protein
VPRVRVQGEVLFMAEVLVKSEKLIVLLKQNGRSILHALNETSFKQNLA